MIVNADIFMIISPLLWEIYIWQLRQAFTKMVLFGSKLWKNIVTSEYIANPSEIVVGLNVYNEF
jgi:hypothetical protein